MSILNILMRILKNCGIKYEEQDVRTILLWCKCNELPAIAKTAFDTETWEEAGKKLSEAASKGDQVATQSLTMWQFVKDSLAQLWAEKLLLRVLLTPSLLLSQCRLLHSPCPRHHNSPLLKGFNRLWENRSMLHQYLSLSLVIPHHLEPPLIGLSDTEGTGTGRTHCVNRAGVPVSSVVTELCSASPGQVTIAGPDPAKFWKHL